MSASRITILHVEDDPNDALLFQHACRLADLTFDLRAAGDGNEAIAYLSGLKDFSDRGKHPFPQLLLLDLKMPGVDGFDVLGWLRREEPCKRLPVIVLTSSNHQADIQRAYDLGANSYLVKPIGFEPLVELARTLHTYWLGLNQQASG